MNRRTAFTLVELLVLLGIVAVLLAVLIPTAARVRARAARAACGAQLNQIGQAFQAYLNDSRGRLPRMNPLPLSPDPLAPGPTLYDVFDPYTREPSHRLWRCPADDGGTFDRYGVSYEYNTFANAMFGGRPLAEALSFARRPPLLITTDRYRVFNDFAPFHGRAGVRGNMNILFADWHTGDLP